MQEDKPITTPEQVMRYVTTLLAGIFIGAAIVIVAIGYAVSESKAIVQVRAVK